MDTLTIITTSFDDEIRRIFATKSEMGNFLLRHERKKLCIENLMKEIRMMELGKAVTLDRDKIEYLGKEFAKTFAKICLLHEERKCMTSLQKSIEQQKIAEDAEYERLFAENVQEYDRSEEL